MARGGHGHPKVSPMPAMPYSSMPCVWATPEMAIQLFQGWLVCRAACGRLLAPWTPHAVRLCLVDSDQITMGRNVELGRQNCTVTLKC